MKIKIQMKDPDCFEQLEQEIVDNLFTGETNLSNEEVDAVVEKRKDAITDLLDTWFEYEEYLTVEVDTETKTIRVVPLNEA